MGILDLIVNPSRNHCIDNSDLSTVVELSGTDLRDPSEICSPRADNGNEIIKSDHSDELMEIGKGTDSIKCTGNDSDNGIRQKIVIKIDCQSTRDFEIVDPASKFKAQKIHYCSLFQNNESLWETIFPNHSECSEAQNILDQVMHDEIWKSVDFIEFSKNPGLLYSKILNKCIECNENKGRDAGNCRNTTSNNIAREDNDEGNHIKVEINSLGQFNLASLFQPILTSPDFKIQLESLLDFKKMELDCLISNLGHGKPCKLTVSQQIKLICAALLVNDYKKPIFILDNVQEFESEVSILAIIQDLIIGKLEGKVIMATHNPAMIELAPKTADIILAKKLSNNAIAIKKVSKTEAVIDISPRAIVLTLPIRQIFCESNTDINFYTQIWSQLRKNSLFGRQLLFSSIGKANQSSDCLMVRQLVNLFSGGRGYSDTKFSYGGMVDRDYTIITDCDERTGLFKLTRYSIENYVFDPLNIAHYFTRFPTWFNSEIANEIKSFLSTTTNPQQIADLFFKLLRPLVNDHLSDKGSLELRQFIGLGFDADDDLIEPVEFSTPNITLSYPKWFLRAKGHLIEECFSNLFGTRKVWNTMNILKSIRRDETCELVVPRDLQDLIFELANVNREFEIGQ